MMRQMADGASGSLVFRVDPLSNAHNVLQPDDVILEVDGEYLLSGPQSCT